MRRGRPPGDVDSDGDAAPGDVIIRNLGVPHGNRVFFIRDARCTGFAIDEIFILTKIDRWFLTETREIVDVEEELTRAKNQFLPRPNVAALA